MAAEQWSNFTRSWSRDHCADVRPFEVAVNSELVRVPRAASPVPIACWSGPLTDRARLEVRQMQVVDVPVTLFFELGCILGDTSESWVRLAGNVTFASALEASSWRPLGSTGGVLARRWTLAASLDPAGGVAEVQCVFEALLDRGTAAAPFFVGLATGVNP